ncbi:hypothetical protein M407DRAFT_27814 [Tulasnella calospora MUT 4182]|uniref:Uncharacterized protein n=1 Tax=Tulasnella calospora MUT 4182 TaxID=1051891 RepID=A0A0C3QBQ0_9AGAM|nr:hypothetical protein M407DRAFT_27814 [Tulasnella calospora MUT 4182]
MNHHYSNNDTFAVGVDAFADDGVGSAGFTLRLASNLRRVMGSPITTSRIIV